MGKNEIPLLPKTKKVYADPRKKRLKEWKKLFEDIHPGIEVSLFGVDEDFDTILDKTHSEIDFGSYYRNARIVILLPDELKMSYLIGLPNNDMYSYVEVLGDSLLPENDTFPCEPNTYTWEYFYNKVYAIANKRKKEIPNPNISDNNLITIGTPTRLIDLKGRRGCIGDTIRFANTEGHVTEHNKILWDEINLCICIGPSPFYKLMESGYIQSITPGRGNFDFEIV